jgi:hypothetical protein
MKRLIVALGVPVLVGIGCSGGEAGGVAPDIINIMRGPSENPDQPVYGGDRPPVDSDRPFGNPQQPGQNPDQPLASSSGGLTCDALCSRFPNCGRRSDYQAECYEECDEEELRILAAMCDGILLEVFQCILANGVVCVDGEARVYGCDHLAGRLRSCFRNRVHPVPDFETGDIYDDEWVETTVPPPPQGALTCDGGSVTLIPSDFCDDFADCEDGTDERNCP